MTTIHVTIPVYALTALQFEVPPCDIESPEVNPRTLIWFEGERWHTAASEPTVVLWHEGSKYSGYRPEHVRWSLTGNPRPAGLRIEITVRGDFADLTIRPGGANAGFLDWKSAEDELVRQLIAQDVFREEDNALATVPAAWR